MSVRTPVRRRLPRAAAAAVVAAVVLALAGCQDDGAGTDGQASDDAGSGPASGSPAGGTGGDSSGEDGSDDGSGEGSGGDPREGEPTLDPEMVMDPPGPREGTLEGADLLIKGRESLPDDLVEQIDQVKGVERSVSLTLADVGVQNRVLNVAAVDPGSYRNFTPYDSAVLQAQWDRVAGGEIAVSDEVQTKKLVDEGGWLRLGNEEDAPSLHLGAEAPQVPQVDAVVNELWGERLGMPTGNALLVTTGEDSPQSVMKGLQKAVGETAAVSILGPKLDPGAFLTAVPTGGSVAEAIGTFRYTVLGGGRIAPEESWVAENIRTEQVPILGEVTCHKAMLPQFRAALIDIQDSGLADEINPDEYAGCFYPRFIAGSTQLSNHSFGTAIDLNVPGNQRGTVGEMDRGVVAIFKKWGFAWGGDWSYTDPMHFEMNRIVTVG